ncbi:MAG: hypothetical protein ABI417_21945 [Coleofasciculaceae cyanobacterium]
MSNFGVRFVASLIPSRIFQGRQTEQKTEQVKRQHRQQPLQQFFTSFTNSNITLSEQYQLAGHPSTVMRFTPNQQWMPPSAMDKIKVPLVLGIRQRSEVTTTKIISVIVRTGVL